MHKQLMRLCVLAFMLMCSPFAMSKDLVVSAAASLNNAFTEVGAEFEKQNPGVKVIFNFAASGVLLSQIEQGAPVDVFASADQATMNRAAAFIEKDSRFDFVENTLVLIVPKGSPVPTQLSDLKGQAYSIIALGTPTTVPAGNYTKLVLEKEQLWSVLEPKFVFGESVRQVLQYVARKEANAGFVYGTDAAISANEVQVAFAVPVLTPLTYPMARIKTSEHAQLAQAFIDFVASQEGQKILARYGFVFPKK